MSLQLVYCGQLSKYFEINLQNGAALNTADRIFHIFFEMFHALVITAFESDSLHHTKVGEKHCKKKYF